MYKLRMTFRLFVGRRYWTSGYNLCQFFRKILLTYIINAMRRIVHLSDILLIGPRRCKWLGQCQHLGNVRGLLTNYMEQLVKKFPAFYGIWRFVTVFTRSHHLSLSWARRIQSINVHHISLRSSLILSSHLLVGLPHVLLPSGFPTRIVCMSHLYRAFYLYRPSYPLLLIT